MSMKGLATEAKNPRLLHFQVWLSGEASTGHGSMQRTGLGIQREQRTTVSLSDKGGGAPEGGRQGW